MVLWYKNIRMRFKKNMEKKIHIKESIRAKRDYDDGLMKNGLMYVKKKVVLMHLVENEFRSVAEAHLWVQISHQHEWHSWLYE